MMFVPVSKAQKDYMNQSSANSSFPSEIMDKRHTPESVLRMTGGCMAYTPEMKKSFDSYHTIKMEHVMDKVDRKDRK